MLRSVSATMAILLISSLGFAAAPKTYQVTGPIVEVKEDTIVVDKKGELWEISKDAAAQVTGELKKGNKVTIKYKMVATEVSASEDTGAKKKK
ncbi:hypothetical protein [Bdellovibrio sp. HCB337]|uniref:hypothetical protein n=1 Tax=Bdellovibrio sp. HCB337 TaxID=3394358 RepID=UPI0039A499F8